MVERIIMKKELNKASGGNTDIKFGKGYLINGDTYVNDKERNINTKNGNEKIVHETNANKSKFKFLF